MSLEEKVEALTNAIDNLAKAVTIQNSLTLGAVPAVETPAKKEATKSVLKKADTKPADKPKAEKDDAPVEGELVITFEDLKKVVVAAADKDKPATAAALKKLGVAKISELKDTQYAAAHDALIAVVEEKSAESPPESSFV